MAASLFTDKETNNWLKACLALNITKDGLAYFLETELKRLKTVVGSSCGPSDRPRCASRIWLRYWLIQSAYNMITQQR
ncbi:hypothetical protein DPMN_140153 [Dreissena polymorpha]|uniref:Uncharacterized protein n=1 Tax=Dreissena polymorpha TaxID=45954 RepID=A0A9D4GAG9_DREPO|nr:hypothetical protein DPMN_140153 [Dreissena polymorpha]